MLRQNRHAHTDYHDSRVKVSKFETSEVVVSTIGLDVDSERKKCHVLISFKSMQQQGNLDRSDSLTRLSVSLSDDRIYCCGLLSLRNALSRFRTNYQQAYPSISRGTNAQDVVRGHSAKMYLRSLDLSP